MLFRNIFFCLGLALALGACTHEFRPRKPQSRQHVAVQEQNGQFQLYRNGAPYFIKGAGIYAHFNGLKEAGGNSIRIYNVSADSALAVLDKAHAAGLTVTVGLNIAHAGILDYSNKAAVAAQLAAVRKDVIRLRNHPALLMWGIGNELNLKIKYKPVWEHYRLWSAVNDIARLIHDLDPNHPTTTMIPSYPENAIRLISILCPEIDILSLNIFRSMNNLPQEVAARGWKGPFIVSEYGNIGHWSAPRTNWYAKLEPTSHQKAGYIQEQYQKLIWANRQKCLGSYAFIWGQKQEYTSTWFSLFTESGQPTEMIDALQYVWTNKWPANRAPRVQNLLLNQKRDHQNIYLPANQKFTATLNAQDLENDDLQVNWEIQKDNLEIYFDNTVGQNKPRVIAKGQLALRDLKYTTVSKSMKGQPQYNIVFDTPGEEGPYRLFMSVSDGQRKAANTNAAFYVYQK